MELPEVRFARIVKENNLTVSLGKVVIKYIDNGGFIAEWPNLQVSFIDPTKEQPKEVVNEPTTEKVSGETPTE